MTNTGKQYSVLTMNTMAFTVNFAVWTMFSIIVLHIQKDLGLSNTEKGILVATPVLTGSLVRLPLGILTDRFGGRIVYFIQMLVVAVSTYGLYFASEYWHYLVVGLFTGLAGGSFAIGIAYTSAWFEKEKQGTAMGIFGAGNAGAAITNLVGPTIIAAWGSWHGIPVVYSIAMLIMAIVFWFLTFDDPKHKAREKNHQPLTLAQQLAPLVEIRVWRFGLAYYFVFGGFVALALWLPNYYKGEFNLTAAQAGYIAMIFVLPSGVIRALGGWMSDRWGGSTTTWWVFWFSIASLFLLSYPDSTVTIHGINGDDIKLELGNGLVWFTVLAFVVGIAQGIGKASVYKSLADYYPDNMGSVGGLVGVIGGLGGFSLPIMFGIAADITNLRTSCFMLMFVVLAGVMIWTWVSEKQEKDAILSRHEDALDELKDHGLVSKKSRWLSGWLPDSPGFWEYKAHRIIAYRNLIISMPALLLSFAVWVVWSIVVIQLPTIGFKFSTGQLFWLAALPGLSGALLRLLYSFIVPIFGGRNWEIFSTLSLLFPTLWIGIAVQDLETSYVVFVVIALLCGLGGGNFSSSMAHISHMFPTSKQGSMLGLNAGFGNLGVAVSQAVVPVIIYGGALAFLGGGSQTQIIDGQSQKIWLQNAGFIWVPFILISTIFIWFGMNNIKDIKASFTSQFITFKEKHAWIMSLLYTGTFGSFIGLAIAFPMLLTSLFKFDNALSYAFYGPLIGALSRPLGGWLAERIGGSKLTFYNFIVMALAMTLVFFSLPGVNSASGSLPLFYGGFMVLFFCAGIGNGSTFKMVPSIFMRLYQGSEHTTTRKLVTASTLGFSSSIAAFGGFLIPAMLAIFLNVLGNVKPAFVIFILFYLVCVIVTMVFYQGKNAKIHSDRR